MKKTLLLIAALFVFASCENSLKNVSTLSTSIPVSKLYSVAARTDEVSDEYTLVVELTGDFSASQELILNENQKTASVEFSGIPLNSEVIVKIRVEGSNGITIFKGESDEILITEKENQVAVQVTSTITDAEISIDILDISLSAKSGETEISDGITFDQISDSINFTLTLPENLENPEITWKLNGEEIPDGISEDKITYVLDVSSLVEQMTNTISVEVNYDGIYKTKSFTINKAQTKTEESETTE